MDLERTLLQVRTVIQCYQADHGEKHDQITWIMDRCRSFHDFLITLPITLKRALDLYVYKIIDFVLSSVIECYQNKV